MEEQPDGFFLEALNHVLEDLVGLALISNQRVLLPVTAQTYPFFQVIHVQEMVLPVAVYGLQQNVILQVRFDIF